MPTSEDMWLVAGDNIPGAGGMLFASDGCKLAEFVAFNIERDIIARGWPEGELLGYEPELMQRVRAQPISAVRGDSPLGTPRVVNMCRGPVGGLRVKRPDASVAVRPVTLYFESRNVQPGSSRRFVCRWSLR